MNKMHIHTYNIAGACTGCGFDADSAAAAHKFCEDGGTVSVACPVHARLIASHREDFATCLQCETIGEGFDFIGIEREAEYVDISRARIRNVAPLFAEETA